MQAVWAAEGMAACTSKGFQWRGRTRPWAMEDHGHAQVVAATPNASRAPECGTVDPISPGLPIIRKRLESKIFFLM